MIAGGQTEARFISDHLQERTSLGVYCLGLRVVFLLSNVVVFFISFSVSGSVKESDTHFTVVVDSFIGKLMKVKVRLSLATVLLKQCSLVESCST